ncbi:hypothetical protein [Nitrosomonas sp. Nm34]|uniref:hypothetical protein n=1 Tax=Nitrosomonas sp. Nm34 TaxID=1881055 RepID=UPI0008DF466D|nr:hypothetical protein [Nitrosomonas sp. Nm34]SFJ05828.1 hypothetical protein SAMN05428978_10923 [Nitrosomonas sp. Nm34]
MKLNRVNYSELTAKQSEIFNFQKVAGLLADFGFNCIKLADDWQGADFLAYHKDGQETLKVQLKSRLTVSKKYLGKELHMAFPVNESWYLVAHDDLVNLVSQYTPWLDTSSWKDNGLYHSSAPNAALLLALKDNVIA